MPSRTEILRKAGSVFDWLISFLMVLGALVLAFLLVAVCWDVFARSVFGRPLAWVLEFTEYGLLYMTFLGAAWALKNEAHVVTDIVLVALSPENRALLNLATSILGAIVSLLLAWFGWEVSWAKLKSGSYQPTEMEPPDFPLFVIISIGSFLLFIQFIRRAYGHYRLWKGPGSEGSR